MGLDQMVNMLHDVLHEHSIVLLMSKRSWLESQRIDLRIC